MTTQDKLDFLKQKFLADAFVKDAAKGYIVVKSFNIVIDPDVLEFASRCWAERFHTRTDIDAVVGLPDAGSRLVSVLANMLRIPKILPSKRTIQIPSAWENSVSFSNTSFTTNQDDVISHIGFVQAGMRVLVIDDVVAHGSTAIAAIKALQARRVEVVGLAVLFDKVWQHGVEQIKAETGVETVSLIRIQDIDARGQITLE